MSRLISQKAFEELLHILDWYVASVYARVEGPGVVPFYCDPAKVGLAAVDPVSLAKADEAALFKLFVSLAMYQARRDTVIQSQQRGWSREKANALLSLPSLRRRLSACPCPHLADAEQIENGCTVTKVGKAISCTHPDLACPIRLAATTWDRMADLGKLPASAFQRIWAQGGTASLLRKSDHEPDPTVRLEQVVSEISHVYRVGRKLATLFVSALSTPALAPGLTPWWPRLNGNLAIVLDTHAGRAVDHLAGGKAAGSYQSRTDWLRRVSEKVDLQRLRKDLPSYSPRLVQQALYAFGSKSNRRGWKLPCAGECRSTLCPFCSPSSQASPRSRLRRQSSPVTHLNDQNHPLREIP